jgi:1-acyl-sn-glycerol-3-phosphate acyltransferase
MIFLIRLRSFISVFVFLVMTVILSTLTILVTFLPRSERIERKIIKFWGRASCALFGVQVKVSGLENWPRDRGAVVLFNHTSFFDIFVMSGYLPDMRFGAKQELFRIPFFGAAMRRAGILPIDRAKRNKVYQVYENSTDRLQAGEKIALAPEGERTFYPLEIQKFKTGPFLFAIRAQSDVVPVVMLGPFDVMNKKEYLPQKYKWGSTIHLRVMPTMSTKGYTFEARSQLQEIVREKMQQQLESLIRESSSTRSI